MKKRLWMLTMAAAAAFALSGCSSDSGASQSEAADTAAQAEESDSKEASGESTEAADTAAQEQTAEEGTEEGTESAGGTLIVGFDQEFPPMGFMAEDGSYTGFDLDLAQEAAKRLGLEYKENAYPFQLSGGQCQRVAIARALALKPKILFFDEPTSALDPELTGEVLKVIRSLADLDIAMVIVTHEMAFARDISHRVIFMADGVIVEQGTPGEVFASDNERTRSFLGRYGQMLSMAG